MKNFEQFKKDFKRDLLVQIVVNMKFGKATREGSKTIAKSIIEVFRENDPETVFRGINKLSETHPEILDIFIKRANEYDERHINERIPQIIVYLKGGETN